MKRLFLYLMMCIFVGCMSDEQEASSSDISKLDTSKTIDRSSNQGMSSDSEDIISKVDTNEYRSVNKIDTTYTIGNDVFNVHLENKFDSSKVIAIPRKYLELVNVSKFSVFESIFHVHLEKNSKVIVDTIFSKSDFEHLSDTSLRKYGILQFPSLQIYRDSLILGFSYSIPLSDVGVYAPITLKLEN